MEGNLVPHPIDIPNGCTYSYFRKRCHSQESILKPKGTLGIVIMSDNAPAKVVTVWPWHYDEPALYIMQILC